ncbi:hypothetical protein HPB47_006771, partial [Ixodes persulcatus]
MSIANSWGRRSLCQNHLRLTLAGQVLTEVSTFRMLNVDLTTTDSASLLLHAARRSASSMLHLFCHISQQSGGARCQIARML